MKKKVIAITITLLVATAGALTLVQCDHSNMARVTIHIQNELYAQKSESIIDKLLKIFSTKLYAAPPWNTDTSSLELKVTATDISTIATQIPQPFNTFTVDIPAGNERQFRLTSISNDFGGGTSINFIGAKEINLSPGDNSLTILMKPATEITGTIFDQVNTLVDIYFNSVDNNWDLTTNFVNYKIYKSTNYDGPYSLIDTIAIRSSSSGTDNGSLIYGNTYYYKISITTDAGEGVLSEPVSVYIDS